MQVERSRGVRDLLPVASQDLIGRALSSFPFPCATATSLCPLGSRATLSTMSISAQGESVRDRDMHSNGKCFAKHFSFKGKPETSLAWRAGGYGGSERGRRDNESHYSSVFLRREDGSSAISCTALRHQITQLGMRFVGGKTYYRSVVVVWFPLFPRLSTTFGGIAALFTSLCAIIIWHWKARLWHCRMGEGEGAQGRSTEYTLRGQGKTKKFPRAGVGCVY